MSDITTPAGSGSDSAAETSTEHLTGPETPAAAEASIPVLVTAEPAKPWYRRRLPWPWRIVTALAGFAAGWLVVAAITGSVPFASHPADAGAEAILAHDGYSGAITISGPMWQQALGSTGGNSGDVAAARVMLSSGTVGFKGDKAEIVFGLTPAGAQLIPAELPSAKPGDFGPGNTAHMDHGYFVIDGSKQSLWGSGTQTSASVSLTAAVTYTAVAHEHGVSDTTNVAGSATISTGDGPVWAYDNLTRKLTATQTGPDTWAVRIDSQGSFSAFANPLDGNAWTGTGSVKGYVNYTVTSGHAPGDANLAAQLPDTMHSGQIVAQWFGVDPSAVQGAVVNNTNYQFTYNPVPVPADNAIPYEGYQGISYGAGPDGLNYTQVG